MKISQLSMSSPLHKPPCVLHCLRHRAATIVPKMRVTHHKHKLSGSIIVPRFSSVRVCMRVFVCLCACVSTDVCICVDMCVCARAAVHTCMLMCRKRGCVPVCVYVPARGSNCMSGRRSAGIGRTGTLIAVHTVLERFEAGEDTNVFEVVKQLKEERTGMVQRKVRFVVRKVGGGSSGNGALLGGGFLKQEGCQVAWLSPKCSTHQPCSPPERTREITSR